VILIELEDRIVMLPKRKPDLSQFFDLIEMEIEEDLERELLKGLI